MSNNILSDLAILSLENFADKAKKIDDYIDELRDEKNSFIVSVSQVRFSNGEAKLKINDSVRNKDLFILCDISNHSCSYKMFGNVNHMSPDDHFQDLKRAVCAVAGKARRITVIMPLLYASRQHKRSGRESLDCALALQELQNLGVHNIITFDAHDPNIQNAIPQGSFDSIYPTYPILKKFVKNEIKMINKDKMLVISPDTGAMGRAIYYANMLGLDVGMFYKRRDYSVIINGKNPIVEHVYTGRNVKDMSAVIVDDMIASGESVLDVARELKERGAKEVNVIASFALFNEGLERFDEAYKNGIIKKVYSTNLSYLNPELKQKPWFLEVDLTRFIALVINTLNNNESISPLLNSQDKIKELIKTTLAGDDKKE